MSVGLLPLEAPALPDQGLRRRPTTYVERWNRPADRHLRSRCRVMQVWLLTMTTASLLSTACAVSVSLPPSTRSVMRSLTESFLYESAEIFYPGGVPDDAVALPVLMPAQRRILERSLQSAMDDLRRVHTQQAEALSKAFSRSINRRVRPTLIPDRANDDRPQAAIDAAGGFTVNAKVVHAMFLAAMVSAFEAEIILHRLKSPCVRVTVPIGSSAERIALLTLFDLKQRIDSGARLGFFGEFVDERPGPGERGSCASGNWGRMIDDAEAFYKHQLFFLLAHELGHVALSHHAGIKEDDSCETSRGRETEADVYASILLAIGTKELAPVDMLGMFGGAKVSSAFEDFFQRAYVYSEFGQEGDAACRYPSPETRLNTTTPPYDSIRLTQIKEYFGNMRRN